MTLALAVSQCHTSSAVVRSGSNDCAIEHIVDLSMSGRIWERQGKVYHVKFYSFRS